MTLKKMLAGMLSLSMLATMMPVTALAEGEEPAAEAVTEGITAEDGKDIEDAGITAMDGDTIEKAIQGEAVDLKITVSGMVTVDEMLEIDNEQHVEIILENDAEISFEDGNCFAIKGGSLKVTGEGTIAQPDTENSAAVAPIVLYGTAEDKEGFSVAEIGGVTLNGWAGISMKQNNEGIENGMRIVLNGTTIDAEANGVYVNGLVDGDNNVIEMDNVEIKSADGIYQAGVANTTVNGGTITGTNCGIVVAAGQMTINGTEVAGGAETEYEKPGTGGGVSVSNAALAIKQHTTGHPVAVTVEDGTFTGSAGVILTREKKADSKDVVVNLDGGKIEATNYGVRVLDGTELTIDGAEITSEGYGVYIRGLGAGSKETTLNVKDGSIEAKYYAISGNGSGELYDHTVVNISGGEITSTDEVAIYQPQNGELNISGGSIQGTSGVFAKDGSVQVSDNAVITGTATDVDYVSKNDGADGTGAAIVLESNPKHGYGTPTAAITGGTMNGSSDAKALEVYKADDADEDADADISGGVFSTPVETKYLKDVEAIISGETYSYYSSMEEAKEAAQEIADETGKNVVVYGKEELKEDGTVSEDAKGETVAPTPEPPRSSGKSSTKYTVKMEDMEDGTVKASSTRVKRGTTVTLTVTPDEGYELDELIVLDEDGEEVELKNKGDGKYTFTMPRGGVEVEAIFVKTEEAEKEETAPAEKEVIKLTIGQKIVWMFDEYVVNDVAPEIKNERTMLPIRMIAEALGAEVAWNEAEQKVTITAEELTIEIFIGQPFATVNGTPVELDAPAYIANDRTYLPLRFVAENLNATVEWDAAESTVTIYQ